MDSGTHRYEIAQANLQRSKLATEELLLEAVNRKLAIALLQEPYVGGIKCMREYRGVRIYQSSTIGEGTVKAAIAVFDKDLDVIQCPQLTTNNIVVVRIRTRAWTITLVSYYFEPDQPMDPYLEHIKKVKREVGNSRFIIGGDANAKSTWWGSPNENPRGKQMCGATDEMGLHILNTGSMPTFDTIRGGKRLTSHVDVTACTEDMLTLVNDWRIEEGLTGSDHNGILFGIALNKSKGTNIQRTTRIFNTRKANWSQFHEKLGQIMQDKNLTTQNIENIQNTNQIDSTVDTYNKAITETCRTTIPTKKHTETLAMPWWSEELAEMKKLVNTRRRRIRNAATTRREAVVKVYLEEKEKYEKAVEKAQTESWKEFCGKQDREGVWEGIYRVIGRTAKRKEDLPLQKDGAALDAHESAQLLAETFYPEDREEDDNVEHRQTREQAKRANDLSHAESHDPPFTLRELDHAARTFNPKKAPGADGFTADICVQAINCDTDFFLSLVNKCLALNYFPKAWKEATVVVLRKPGKETYSVPKSYRPIGLLPVLGKIYEKMLVARLKYHVLPKISPRQYGFMPQKSTEDSLYTLMQHIRMKLDQKKIITMVSLDIEGAFDSAWWPAIKVRLAEADCPVNLRRVIDSYLTDRQVNVRYAGVVHSRNTNKGCVQGSIGGPILWNLLLDPLLRELETGGSYCQAFADDIVLIFDGDTSSEIERRAGAALEHVLAWGVMNRLKFAPHKTCAMVITRRLKYDTPRLSMGGISIGMSQEMKLLGLTIDRKLTFNTHVAAACKKAIAIYKQLARTARVSWGLHPEIVRLIYTAAVEPIILYAANVWAPAANKLGVRKQLNVVQRGFAQKMCRAYRTVSLNSALILTGILPLDLRIREVASLYEAKKGLNHVVLGDWEIERMALKMDAPHPADQMCLGFVSLVDEEKYSANQNFEVRIFTDGSKIEGKVGAALSIWKDDAEAKSVKLALSHYCTVYQAELLALCKAAETAVTRKETTIGIYSDSMSALQTVTNNGSVHPLAVETRDALRRCKLRNKRVSLFWIKAHAGLEGNERADQLAKEAALKSKTRPAYDQCPVSFVRRKIRLATVDEWDTRYRAADTASITKLFFPDATTAYRNVRKIRHTQTTTQLMTGHGGFSAYLNRFKLKESPSCSCDPGVEETVPHLIAECPIFNKLRFEIEQKLDHKICIKNLPELVSGKNRDKVLEYCCKIVKQINAKNKAE